ncbi:MAG: VOC family protein [Planctomycetaceae bacterium]|nr:VOC family protein [Planctomycetaceae bacterium]
MFSLQKPVVDIAIVCSDFEKSLDFYHNLLGLEIVQEVEIPATCASGAQLAPREFRQVRLRAGETLIKLMEIESPPEQGSTQFRAGVRWLTFIIDDVPGTKAALEAKGVEFLSDPVAAPDARYIVCATDPDGLLLEFVQID